MKKLQLAVIFLLISHIIYCQAGEKNKTWSWIYSASLDSLEKHLSLNRSPKKDTTIFAIYDDLTGRYNMMGNSAKSIEMSLKMQEYALLMNNKPSYYYAKTVEAMLKASNGTHLNAIDANRVYINYILDHKNQYDLLNTITNLNLATSYRNIAQLYAFLRIDSALYYYDKAITVVTPKDYERDLYNCLSNEIIVQRGVQYGIWIRYRKKALNT